MNTRKFSRVRFNIEAVVKTVERQFQGAVENLSMTGVFLLTSERLDLEKVVEVTITLTGASPDVVVNFNGKVSRIAENGIGFVIEKIDLDSYMHLKNIVAYNIDDAEKVMEEICHSIDEKLSVEQ